jgi:hypothetical protein
MKKLAFFYLLLLMGLPVGCFKTLPFRMVHYHYITNTTGKRIVHEVICNPKYVGKDTLRFFSSGATVQAAFEWETSVTFPNQREFVVYLWETNIYCIDDTTLIVWGGVDPDPDPDPFASYPAYVEWRDQHFKGIELKREDTDDEHIWTSEYHVTVDDTLLHTMQKDYTMLEKFKEYYDASE